MSEGRLQEIVTKAVVGRAERQVKWTQTVPADGVTGVYGVHVTGYEIEVELVDGRPVVNCAVQADLWCGTGGATKIMRIHAEHTEGVNVRTVGKVLGQREIRARLVTPAKVTGVDVQNGAIQLGLVADVVLELSGTTRLAVRAFDVEDDDGDTDAWTDDSSGAGSGSGSGSGSGE
ncbi:MAG TPA: hypothetical protein VK191_06365 [Symbiobacteriaceae bacterium]|nr:hypothetical protein [Symbiobacteriaceae bacterium]